MIEVGGEVMAAMGVVVVRDGVERERRVIRLQAEFLGKG